MPEQGGGGGISLPGAPHNLPGLPNNWNPLIFEEFAGLNTKALRPGIQPAEMSWCNGFIPFGPNNARVLWGTGPVLTSSVGTGFTYAWFGFGNIFNTNYCFVVVSDGRILQINMTTLAITLVAVGGTIQSPSNILGFSQWGSQYILFAKDQENGYWIWDGSVLYTAGTIGPVVSVDAGGENYTSSPTFVVQTTGTGSGVVLSPVQIENGSVTQVTVQDAGTGFGPDDFIAVAVQGGGTDNQAYVTPLSGAGGTGGGLDEVYVIEAGSGYTGYAYVTVSGGGGTGASVSLSIQNGAITGAAVVDPGINYTSAPTLAVVDPGIPGTPPIPGGTGGVVAANITLGQIQGLVVAYGGTGYVSPPQVRITGDGTGATAIAQISGGAVTSIDVTAYGKGYSNAVIELIGGNNAANVSLALMPFGISGTWIEVYEGHVWVGNGAAVATFPPQSRVLFSEPDSPVGFGNGGGVFDSTDSFLRTGYHAGKQSNGFLYLIGDSSMNYVSGVQTSTPSSTSVPAIPVTTFGNLNVDPQIGTPWPGSVQVFSRNIVFANTIGVYVSYGGAVKKVSDQLDGFYASDPVIFGSAENFTAAVASIFGIPVYMLLLPIMDPFLNAYVTKLLIWDGKKWFTSDQDRNLVFIATQEQNSVLTAWGTDGTSIFPLFYQPTTAAGFKKIIQSKLFAQPGYFTTKTSRSLSGILYPYAVDESVEISIDSEAGLGTGNALVTVSPTNNIEVFGPVPVGQQGRLIGLTLQTTASDLAVLSLMLSDTVESPNV